MKHSILLGLAGVAGVALGSVTQDIAASQTPGVYWSSVRTATRSIALDWPEGAAKAQLVIQPLSKKARERTVIEIAAGTEAYAWSPFAGEVPEKDELFSLTLTYLDGTGTAVGDVLSAEVAVLKNSFGAADIPLDATTQQGRQAGIAAIIPYDAAWFTNAQAGATATLVRTKDGTSLTVTNALEGAGWFGWNFRRSGFGSFGTMRLALTNGAAEESYDAALEANGPGMNVIIR